MPQGKNNIIFAAGASDGEAELHRTGDILHHAAKKSAKRNKISGMSGRKPLSEPNLFAKKQSDGIVGCFFALIKEKNICALAGGWGRGGGIKHLRACPHQRHVACLRQRSGEWHAAAGSLEP